MGMMSKNTAFISRADPLGMHNERQDLARKAREMAEGTLPVEFMASLPWKDHGFCVLVQQHLERREKELEAHRVRFKALREVFGPER